MATRLNWNNLSKYRNQIYALSILWVFLFHVDSSFPSLNFFERIPLYIIRSGNLGVDVFLFMSGISMYYARKKSTDTVSFLKRRYMKIIKIYLTFCVPFLIFYYLVGKMSFDAMIRQITFTRARVSSFWFLLCIVICYTIYPLLYKLICEKKKHWIVIGVVAYVAGLMLLNHVWHAAFQFDEIMITRFPIFVIGSLFGEKVYNKEEISPGFLFSMLLVLIGPDVLSYFFKYVPLLAENRTLVTRLFGGAQSIGAVFLFTILLPYLEGTKLNGVLSKFGTMTLEFYVAHIAVMHLLLHILGIHPGSKRGVLLFTIVWFLISLLITVIYHRLLYGQKKKVQTA